MLTPERTSSNRAPYSQLHVIEGGEGSEVEREGESGDDDSDEDDRPLRKRKLTLEERQQERAAGDHPLQQRFKELSKSLLKKHTGEAAQGECSSKLQ